MAEADDSQSFYLFDIDDNLLFLSTNIYLWNAESQTEQAISSSVFSDIQNQLGLPGKWEAWNVRGETFRDFRDRLDVLPEEQAFVRDLLAAVSGSSSWQGPSWPLLVHAAEQQRAIAIVTARGHEPTTIEAGLQALVTRGLLSALPPILGIYTVTNEGVRKRLHAEDPAMTIPSIKKLAIKDAVETALARYGSAPPHRFGMSDDDVNNVALATSAMRDCKLKYPDKRFFVINTNQDEFVKLEIFPMAHPVTAAATGEGLLRGTGQDSPNSFNDICGGNTSIYISDLNRAVEFYTGALGLKLRTRIDDEWADVDAGNGLVIRLNSAHPPATPLPGTGGAINIELKVTKALEDVVAMLKGRGVSFIGDIQDYESSRVASFSDPDGNVLLLAEILQAGDASPID